MSLRLAEAGAIQLLISDDIMAEVAKVLRGDKFVWSEPEIEKALRQLSRFTERVQPTQRLDIIKSDPSDNQGGTNWFARQVRSPPDAGPERHSYFLLSLKRVRL